MTKLHVYMSNHNERKPNGGRALARWRKGLNLAGLALAGYAVGTILIDWLHRGLRLWR